MCTMWVEMVLLCYCWTQHAMTHRLAVSSILYPLSSTLAPPLPCHTPAWTRTCTDVHIDCGLCSGTLGSPSPDDTSAEALTKAP
jgi:hypothetical protein